MVMERLHGPTMLEAMAAGDLAVTTAAVLLADLHRRLHELPAARAEDPAVRVLHLDLHPDNVVLSSRGPVVIDWRNAAEGSPDLDVAVSAVILAEVAVDGAHPMATAAGDFLTEFLRSAGGDPWLALDEAVAMRRANPMLAAEEVSLLPGAAALVRRCR